MANRRDWGWDPYSRPGESESIWVREHRPAAAPAICHTQQAVSAYRRGRLARAEAVQIINSLPATAQAKMRAITAINAQ